MLSFLLNCTPLIKLSTTNFNLRFHNCVHVMLTINKKQMVYLLPIRTIHFPSLFVKRSDLYSVTGSVDSSDLNNQNSRNTNEIIQKKLTTFLYRNMRFVINSFSISLLLNANVQYGHGFSMAVFVIYIFKLVKKQ